MEYLRRAKQSTPLPSIQSFYNNNRGTTLQEGVEEGKLYMYFPLFKLAKHQRGTLGQSVSANYVC